jgi:hypothetical protein
LTLVGGEIEKLGEFVRSVDCDLALTLQKQSDERGRNAPQGFGHSQDREVPIVMFAIGQHVSHEADGIFIGADDRSLHRLPPLLISLSAICSFM